MKRIEFLLVMLFLSLVSAGQQYTTTKNYVVEKIYLDPTTSVSNARTVSGITYLDGFGRKLQEIQILGAPGGTGDLVKPYQYGVQGRTEKEYLPYARNNNQGGYVEEEDAFLPSNWDVYGPTDAPYAFTLTGYDNSPLNRVVKQTGPGKTWYTGGKGVTTTYGMNAANEVRLYRVASDGSLLLGGTYAAGNLQKETVTDEDGCQVETFKDNDGRVVLVVNVENTSSRLETYSVHDDRGRLCYVLSPEASARLGTTINETFLAQFAYRYDYDRFSRMIRKRLPGCDPVYLVYDKRDRLVMSQDGKQRVETPNKWSYSLYDGQNRVTETGEVVISGTVNTHAGLQAAASVSTSYTPTGTRTAYQYTVYDNYRPTTIVTALPFVPATGYSTGNFPHVTGLVTSVKTRAIDTNIYLTSTTYYDDRCRVIQTVSENLQGQKSRVDIGYDFTGNIIRQRESHGTSVSRTDVLEVVNAYDDRGRLLNSTAKLNGGTPATTTCTYDAVGRLVSRKQGTVTETSAYNVRGWLTSKESVPFKMKLRYESPLGDVKLARYNGNISEWEWQQGTGAALMYGFMYDKFNRLTGTTQKQKTGTSWTDLAGHYLEKGITYDRNGNIKTLQRTAGGSTVDNLVYSYTGNQLTSLTENTRTSPANDIYSPGTVVAGTYNYDRNGNLSEDGRKVLKFSYNVLNLLSEVKGDGKTKAIYCYLADGTKLNVRDRRGTGANGFDYLGSLTYKRSGAVLQLETANFGSGVIRVNGSSGAQEVNYFLTDHLGSVRVIVDGSGVVKERNDYYAFGAKHVRADYPQNDNRLKYNGKEEQVTGDLKYLDYGWRMYDSGLGRWFCVDLKSEKYFNLSPYVYCMNNPVRLIDPNGMEISPALFWNWIIQLMGVINDQWSYYENRKSRLEMKMGKTGISDKKLERLSRRYAELEERQNLYEKAFDEIIILAKSSQLYDWKLNDSRNSFDISVASLEFENGTVMINMPTNGRLGLFSHELKHAYQFETGRLNMGGHLKLYDKNDEVEAYQRGALFGGQKYSTKNLPDSYNTLEAGPIDVTNHPNLKYILNQSDILRMVAIRAKSIFRYNGVTYGK